MSPKREPSKSPFDADGKRLRLSDLVISTPLYDLREMVEGRIKKIDRNLITVLHETGSRTGQLWRSAAHLWRLRT